MSFDVQSIDRDLEVNRDRWKKVSDEIARARGIDEQSTEMRCVRRDIMNARFEIAFTAKEVIPDGKASRIAAYHLLSGSTPPPPMIKRSDFTGLNLDEAAAIVTQHLVAGRAPKDIRSTVVPYFMKGQPQRVMQCAA